MSTDQHHIRAAQYVRMSTELQRYSTENQKDAIATYALQRNIAIVRTYADEGRSGLTFRGRSGLKSLISDVINRRADFELILVYDVSRWGRFQDADESAYYEFLCREAGIKISYCAEPFENDGTLISAIIKNLKRVMAAEYSRELSVKVSAGRDRVVKLGFHGGGEACTGFGRLLVDEHRNPVRELAPRQQKNLKTERVVLIKGAPEEIALVHRIYREFLEDRKAEQKIAADLNAEGLQNEYGRPWTRMKIHGILTNEKYIGISVHNRVSQRLKHRVVNPPEKWTRIENACGPLIDKATFLAVRKRFAERWQRHDDDHYLEALRALLAEKGFLSSSLIDRTPAMSSSSNYAKRFGSLGKAYELIGYKNNCVSKLELVRAIHELETELLAQIVRGIETTGVHVSVDSKARLVRVEGGNDIQIAVVPCHFKEGKARWDLWSNVQRRSDLKIALRLDEANRQVQDYYLMPRMDKPQTMLRLAKSGQIYFNDFRFEDLRELFDGRVLDRVSSVMASGRKPIGHHDGHRYSKRKLSKGSGP